MPLEVGTMSVRQYEEAIMLRFALFAALVASAFIAMTTAAAEEKIPIVRMQWLRVADYFESADGKQRFEAGAMCQAQARSAIHVVKEGVSVSATLKVSTKTEGTRSEEHTSELQSQR